MSKTIASNAAAHEDRITSLVWTAKNEIITGSIDETVSVWNPDSLTKPVVTFKDQELSVVGVSANADGSSLVTSCMDGHLRCYDLAARTQTSDINAGPLQSWAVAAHPSAARAATGSHRGAVTVYNTSTGASVLTAAGDRSFTHSVAYSPDGKLIASGHADGTVEVIDAESGSSLFTLSHHTAPVRALAFLPDSSAIVSGGDDARVFVCASSGGRLLASPAAHQSWVLSIAASPAGGRIATAGADGKVVIWDTVGWGVLLTVTPHQGKVWAVAFSQDGQRIATGGDEGALCVTAIEA